MSIVHPRSRIFEQGPIITSLLDIDFYKLTMLQAIWRYYRDAPVQWDFLNRTQGVSLGRIVPEQALREELEHVRTLRFNEADLRYLASIRIAGKPVFLPEFLADLPLLRLPELNPERVELNNGAVTYRIESIGTWYETSTWETFKVCIVGTLRARYETKAKAISETTLRCEFDRRLDEKIFLLESHRRTSAGDRILLMEFGTRRRLSSITQDLVLDRFLYRIPEHVAATSNVLRAQRYGIQPGGTNGHEITQVLYGIARSRGEEKPAHWAQQEALRIWWEMYGAKLAIALTDTWGTEFFLNNFSPEQAMHWRGYRLDSGDLIAKGEKILAFLNGLARQGFAIEPEKQLLIPSDGMTIPTIIEFAEHFSRRAKGNTGAIGTNGTFDVGPLLLPCSLVDKIVSSCGYPAPKLSDNPAKAVGDPKEIKRVKREVGYEDRPAQPLVY